LETPYQTSSGSGAASEEKSSVITFQAQKLKREFEVSVDEETQEINCLIKLDIYGAIMSYPSQMNRKIDREQLNQHIGESLNKQAVEVVHKLLKSNCDALGIGRRLKVNHSELWKNMNWEKAYKKVEINTEIHVHIKNTGVIR
jgi:hypothetical protein